MCRLLLIASIIAVLQPYSADAGMVTIGDNTYYISDSSRLIWNEAQDACRGMGMELLSLQSSTKNEEIMAYFRANGMGLTSYWTGGMKTSSGGWEWSGTGQSFSYTDWASGQPDDATPEAFVDFNAVDGWFDMPASLKIHYVCE